MKKKLTLIGIIIIALSQAVLSQNVIAVQNGGSPSFFTTFQSAINGAQDGDSIYLPGGVFNEGDIIIDKSLNIFGAGFFPDSSSATEITYVNGDVHIKEGADNGSLSGIYCKSIFVGTNSSDNDIDNYTIIRNRLYSISYGFSSGDSSQATNISVIGCVITGNIQGGNSNSSAFLNNIIQGRVYSFASDIFFQNNIFLYTNASTYCSSGNQALFYLHGATFNNNIFLWHRNNCSIYYISDGIFRNNLFVSSNPGIGEAFLESNSIYDIPQSSIFINQTGYSYDLSHDYHLQSSCPGKNAGRDGTDLGIYGGAFPWKEGSIPFNPHFQEFNISSVTDSTGNLNVNIQVEAQDY